MTLQALAPLLALAGTVIVALIGFYQWKRQYSNPNRQANAAARREAYEGLWQKLEEINLAFREQQGGNPDLFERLREINGYFLAHSLYFDDQDQVLINDYITAMNTLRERIFTAGPEETVSSFRASMNPSSFLAIDKGIKEAAERVQELRNRLKKKLQQIVATA